MTLVTHPRARGQSSPCLTTRTVPRASGLSPALHRSSTATDALPFFQRVPGLLPQNPSLLSRPLFDVVCTVKPIRLLASFFFFNAGPPPETSPFPLHDAFPI